jgi:hypothetical protein
MLYDIVAGIAHRSTHKTLFKVYLNLKTNIILSECACKPHYRLVRNQHHRHRDAYEVVVCLVRTQMEFHSLQFHHYHRNPPYQIFHY